MRNHHRRFHSTRGEIKRPAFWSGSRRTFAQFHMFEELYAALLTSNSGKLWILRANLAADPSRTITWWTLMLIGWCCIMWHGVERQPPAPPFHSVEQDRWKPVPMKTFKILPEISACLTYYDSLLCTRHLVCEVNKDSVSRTTTYSERIKTSTTLVLL